MDVASEFCGASLKDGATSSLDFLPAVVQMGEKVADPFPYCGTGSQTHRRVVADLLPRRGLVEPTKAGSPFKTHSPRRSASA